MERRAIHIRGIVQGVGFRPFVYHLATRYHLAGMVRNQTGSVVVEVEGETSAFDDFLGELADHPRPLALIEHLSWEARPPRGDRDFRIDASTSDPKGAIFISPDATTWPNSSIQPIGAITISFIIAPIAGRALRSLPACHTTDREPPASFPLCRACRAEYDDPRDRRFHAQPVACPACGPRLSLFDARGTAIATDDPLNHFAAALLDGRIGTLKGLGGYHLACDARSPSVVAELRRRKHRDEKPFAVMAPDLSTATRLGEVGPKERSLLQSPAAPIVLLRKRADGGIAENVAPGNPSIGVMLPYSPLHHLLLRAVGVPLVMTSGYRSDEPIAYRDDVFEKLSGIADLVLTHNRPIHVRCDDSVTRVIDEVELPVRRSRGYAPRPIPLPFDCPAPILALGGQLKSVFALDRGRQAFLSHHLGDLDHYEAMRAFEHDVSLYEQLVAIAPEWIVHDQHPDYATTHYAARRQARSRTRLLSVQHHHAHMASCMAEHGLAEPVIGVTFDGTGYGDDGAVWGGEFLVGDYRSFRRWAHLRYVGMPGGERAIREPWRMAAAHLMDANADFPLLEARCLQPELATMRTMLERRINSPLTSSMGRLFDAVASLAGIRDRVNYEGQAAIELEGLATTLPPDSSYPFVIEDAAKAGEPFTIDTRPLIRAVVQDTLAGTSAALVARRFHSSLVEMVGQVSWGK